jgi:hypothetical protein
LSPDHSFAPRPAMRRVSWQAASSARPLGRIASYKCIKANRFPIASIRYEISPPTYFKKLRVKVEVAHVVAK